MKKYEKGLRTLIANILFGMLVMGAPVTVAVLITKLNVSASTAALVGLAELGFSALFAWTSRIVVFEDKKAAKNVK